jgi:hypothetical protein
MHSIQLFIALLVGKAIALPQQLLPIVEVIPGIGTTTTLFSIPSLPLATMTATDVVSPVTAGSCAIITANPLRDNVCLDFTGNVDDSICCPAGTACEAVVGSRVFLCN